MFHSSYCQSGPRDVVRDEFVGDALASDQSGDQSTLQAI